MLRAQKRDWGGVKDASPIGATRVERATSCSQSRRSSQAELRPDSLTPKPTPRKGMLGKTSTIQPR